MVFRFPNWAQNLQKAYNFDDLFFEISINGYIMIQAIYINF